MRMTRNRREKFKFERAKTSENARIKSLTKKLVTIMLGIAMIFVAIPGGLTFAEDTAGSGGSGSSGTGTDDSASLSVATPTIAIENSTAYAGSSGTIYVKGSNFENITALKISVIYDSSAIKVTGASASSLVSGASSDINYTSVDGKVSQSVMSATGINGSGTLMTISYYVDSNVSAGEKPLMLIVEEAIATVTDSETKETSFVSVTANKTHGKVTVIERAQTVPTASFNAYTSTSSLKQGDSFDYYLRSYSVGNLAGGSFEFTYDRGVLKLDSVSLGTTLTKSGVNAEVNDGTAGFVKVTFAGTEILGAGYYATLVKLSFTAKVDDNQSTEIAFNPVGLQALTYDEDSKAVFTTMSSSGFSRTVNISKKDVEVTYPKFSLVYEELSHGETFAVTAMIDGDSKLAAGDFAVNYDKDACVCTGVEACTDETEDTGSDTGEQTATKSNSIIITNPKFSDGTVKFSFVNTDGITEDENLVKMTFKILKQSGQRTIKATGTGTVDTDFNSVTLDYPQLTVDLSHCLGEWTTTKEATFDVDGQMQSKCSGCDRIETKTIPKHVYGDVNRDGEVNAVDALVLKRYQAKWDGYDGIDRLAADVNADGTLNLDGSSNPDDAITLNDLIFLERHLAGWAGYETLPVTKSDLLAR